MLVNSKFTLVLCFLLGLQVWTKAQSEDYVAKRFNAAFLLGLNASQIDGDQSAGYNLLGLNVGIRGVVNFTQKVALNVELQFDQKGSRNAFVQGQTIDPFFIKTSYISVPVLVSYKDWYIPEEDYFKVNAFAGLVYGRLFNTRISNFSQAVADNFRQNDVGFQAGIGFNVNTHIGFTLRYNHSLTPIFKLGDGGINANSLISKHITLQGSYTF